MPSFYRILTYLFLCLYACVILFITANAAKVLSMGNDFQSQYAAARLQTVGTDVYNLREEAVVQTEATGRKTNSFDVVPYINSPLVLLLITPLGRLPFAIAYMVWVGVLYVLLLVCWHLLSRLYDVIVKDAKTSIDAQAKDLFLLVAVIVHPVIVALFAGQLSFFLLLAMLGSYLFLRTNQDMRAGASLALLFVKPYLLAAPLIYLAYKRRWRAIASCVILLAALYVIAWTWLGSEPFVRYSSLARSLFWIGDEPMKIHLSRQIGLRGLVYALSGSSIFTYTQLAVWLILIAVSSALVFLNLSKENDVGASDWAMICVLMVLSAIHMHGHDGVILLFPLLVWYVYSGIAQWKKTVALVVLTISLLPIIFYAGPAVSVLLVGVLGYRYSSSRRNAHVV